jgi:16S rRNA processing protein RimM
MAEETFEIGVVRDAHGLDGALRIQLFDASSDALVRHIAMRLRSPGGEATTITVRAAAEVPGKPGMWRVVTDEIRDRDEALALRGHLVEIDRTAASPIADDEYFLADAIGRPVRRHGGDAAARSLGTIIAVTSNGAQDLFEVQYRGADGRKRTWLLPVLPQMIREVTPDAVLVDLPLGMLPDELEADDG